MAPHDSNLDAAFGNWLAGFADGEGCFLINRGKTPNGFIYSASFEISLRIDDKAILDEIKERTGLGSVTLRDLSKWKGNSGNDRDKARWMLSSRSDCRSLVSIFDAYPLRAKKARDYSIWREAVMEWIRVPARAGSGNHRNARDWSLVASLKDQLQQGRMFTLSPHDSVQSNITVPSAAQLSLDGYPPTIR